MLQLWVSRVPLFMYTHMMKTRRRLHNSKKKKKYFVWLNNENTAEQEPDRTKTSLFLTKMNQKISFLTKVPTNCSSEGSLQEQSGDQYLTQGHFDMKTEAAEDWTTDLRISGRLALPSEPQPTWTLFNKADCDDPARCRLISESLDIGSKPHLEAFWNVIPVGLLQMSLSPDAQIGFSKSNPERWKFIRSAESNCDEQNRDFCFHVFQVASPAHIKTGVYIVTAATHKDRSAMCGQSDLIWFEKSDLPAVWTKPN